MPRSCSWCGTSVSRLWEIPRSRNRSNQWVCKDCHTDYFNGDRDAQGVKQTDEDRVI